MTALSGPVWGGNARWQIRLRWVVPPAMLIGLGLGRLMGWRVPAAAVGTVALFVLAYNVLFWLILAGRMGASRPVRWIGDRAAVLQVTLDYAVTFALVTLTGGIASPLVLFLLFHVVFAAILLPPTTAWLFAIVAGGGLALVVSGQAIGLVPAPAVFGAGLGFAPPPPFVGGYLLTFAATALVLAAATAAIVGRLRHETARALRATEALAEERERLTLQVVHNLRSPLGAAVGLLDLLGTGTLGPIADEQRRYLERATSRLRAMGDALGELLTLARRAAHPASVRREAVDLAEVAQAATEVFRPRASEAGIALEVRASREAVVFGDRRALVEVVENLVSNAIRYTPGGGRVRVVVDRPIGEDGDAAVELRVEDTGIGIPEADLARVFDEFFRSANAKAADPSGTGLGLSIVRQVVQLHGGTIAVDSREGEGTAISVRLPLGSGAAGTAKGSESGS